MSAAALTFAVDWETLYSHPALATLTFPRDIDAPLRRPDLSSAFDSVPWSHESFSIGDPRLWSLYEVWLNVQDSGHGLPVWSLDLIPRLAPWLPDMFEVRFPGPGARISRFSSNLIRSLGMDMVGRDLAGDLLGPGGERIDADARHVRSIGFPLWSDDELRRHGAPPVACECLMLPFADTAGQPTRLVGCLYLRGTHLTPGWLGTITRFVNLWTTVLD